MTLGDRIFGSIPVVRMYWWRHKVWSRLDIPAVEWERLDNAVEEMADALRRVRALENVILNAHEQRTLHGMNTRHTWVDATGKERGVDFVLDGSGGSEPILDGYEKELDRERREMVEMAADMSRWAVKNAVRADYAEKAPLLTVLGAFVKQTVYIVRELNKLAEGKTADEFLRAALLDRESRAKRLGREKSAERVRLEKPEKREKPAEPKPRKASGEEARRREMAVLLPRTFLEQGVETRFVAFVEGRAVTRYKLRLERGQKFSKAKNISEEVAMRIGVDRVAISKAPDEAQIIYVDVPNRDVKPLLYADAPREPGKFFVGESIEGKPVFADMESLCHLLIAGTTGSGKSTFLNSVICSMIQDPPTENQFLMIDPKMVELTPYDGIPHLWRPVVTNAKEAVDALEQAAQEMERRYQKLRSYGVKNLSEYNREAVEPMPCLAIVIDELADLMIASKKEVESPIVRIAQKGRAAGVHLIVATQRPSADVITGLMKANIPSRIAFSVASAMESRIILDEGGAERLAGKGDMLYKPADSKARRLQGAYISTEEVLAVVGKVREPPGSG